MYVNTSSAVSRKCVVPFGKRRRRLVATFSSCSRASAAPGCAKIVRTSAATIACAWLGTWARRFRVKCTRQRCQLAPARISAMASFRASWASEMTSLTPSSRS